MKVEVWDLLIGKLIPRRELEVHRSWNPETWKVACEILISDKHLIK
jgi:hypothetical protein